MTTGLLRHPLPFPLSVEAAFGALDQGQDHALWLDEHGERGSGVSYLAFPTALPPGEWASPTGGSLLLGQHGSSSFGLGSVPLGIFFVLPYEAGHHFVGIDSASDLPTHALWVDRLVAIDHRTGASELWALGDEWSGETAQWRESTHDLLERATEPPVPVTGDSAEVIWRDSEDRYREMIRAAHTAITEGEAYQLCLTTGITIPGACDPVGLHRILRRTSPTHHQALIRLGDITLVSASPETFLEISRSGRVVTKPIKGTRPRHPDPDADRALAKELLESDKERAENLMIVDLMRNDLSKVCEVGSVVVPALCVLESYATVHQLVSTIEGQLRPGVGVWEVLTHCFPAGSMTGAPKKRAMEVLQAEESGPRGYYSGVYGIERVDGSATVAMTIRTAVVTPDSLSLGVGGGITALSVPGEEIREVGVKARAFFDALGVSSGDYS